MAGVRRARDVHVGGAVIGNPLVAIRNVVQPVIVGDARRVHGQLLAHLSRATDGRLPGGRTVGCLLLDSKVNLIRGRAGQRCLVPRVVLEGDPHLDGLAYVVGHQGVGIARRIRDVRVRTAVVGNPLVGERSVFQPVRIGDAEGVRRERLAYVRRSSDDRFAGGGVVGCLLLDSKADRLRRLAGQGLLVPVVVGETALHFDGFAIVGCYEGIGGVRRTRDVRVRGPVVSYPLVAVGNVGQPIGVGNAGGVRRQRLSYVRRSSDGRRSGGRVVLGGLGRLRSRYVDKFGPYAEPDGVDGFHAVGVKLIGYNVGVGVLGRGAARVVHVYE